LARCEAAVDERGDPGRARAQLPLERQPLPGSERRGTRELDVAHELARHRDEARDRAPGRLGEARLHARCEGQVEADGGGPPREGLEARAALRVEAVDEEALAGEAARPGEAARG